MFYYALDAFGSWSGLAVLFNFASDPYDALRRWAVDMGDWAIVWLDWCEVWLYFFKGAGSFQCVLHWRLSVGHHDGLRLRRKRWKAEMGRGELAALSTTGEAEPFHQRPSGFAAGHAAGTCRATDRTEESRYLGEERLPDAEAATE